MQKESKVFSITKTVKAPCELVFNVFTQAEHLQHWWGPVGLSVTVKQLSLQPGGVFHFAMQAPNGDVNWGRFVFKEIAAPEKLVWINSFSDANGGLTRHPMAPDWPLEMMVSITFSEQNGMTTISLDSWAINASAEETNVFETNFDSMNQGFGGTFTQLENYLQKINL